MPNFISDFDIPVLPFEAPPPLEETSMEQIEEPRKQKRSYPKLGGKVIKEDKATEPPAMSVYQKLMITKTLDFRGELRALDQPLIPGRQGKYFRLVRDIALEQQRDRILICPPRDYPSIEMAKGLAQKLGWTKAGIKKDASSTPLDFGDKTATLVPHQLSIEAATDGLSQNFIQTIFVSGWSFGIRTHECRVKSPTLLTNDLDRAEAMTNKPSSKTCSYIYRIRILHMNAAGGYDVIDEITTNRFYTVSHSKMVVFKRRPVQKRGPKKRLGRPRRKETTNSEEDFENLGSEDST